jgi:hypothetical protein
VVLPPPNIDTLCIDTRKAGVTPAFLFEVSRSRVTCLAARISGEPKNNFRAARNFSS